MSESWRGSFLCSLHSACASAFAQPQHRTLWPERVQLLGWWAWLSEVIDFGMAAILDGPGAAGYWLTADLWSFGVFLYHAFLGVCPLQTRKICPPTFTMPSFMITARLAAVRYVRLTPASQDWSNVCYVVAQTKGLSAKISLASPFSMVCNGVCCLVGKLCPPTCDDFHWRISTLPHSCVKFGKAKATWKRSVIWELRRWAQDSSSFCRVKELHL